MLLLEWLRVTRRSSLRAAPWSGTALPPLEGMLRHLESTHVTPPPGTRFSSSAHLVPVVVSEFVVLVRLQIAVPHVPVPVRVCSADQGACERSWVEGRSQSRCAGQRQGAGEIGGLAAGDGRPVRPAAGNQGWVRLASMNSMFPERSHLPCTLASRTAVAWPPGLAIRRRRG